MKTILTVDKQTIFDIAVQHYGTIEAVQEILALNPQIENDLKGYNVDLSEFQLDLPVKANSLLTIDDNSSLINKNLLKEITETVTTFEIWQEQ
jgi:hypothetical protein